VCVWVVIVWWNEAENSIVQTRRRVLGVFAVWEGQLKGVKDCPWLDRQ
jgi:hypothetical protein